LRDKTDHSIEGLWRAIKNVFDEYPEDTISIECGNLHENYDECLRHNGDNRLPTSTHIMASE